MRTLPREPRVENKYNLTITDIKKLIVGNRKLIGSPLFQYSKEISAWINTGCAGPSYDLAEYEILIYDENAPQNAGKFDFCFTLHSDYDFPFIFNQFYYPNDIHNSSYLSIQEEFLNVINQMIDSGILLFPFES